MRKRRVAALTPPPKGEQAVTGPRKGALSHNEKVFSILSNDIAK